MPIRQRHARPAAQSLGALALPLLAAIRQRYPAITLQLTEELTGNLAGKLRAGRVNLAVLFDDGQLGGFAATPLAEEELRFICRFDAPQAARDSLTLRAALDTTLILPGPQHGARWRRAAPGSARARWRTDAGACPPGTLPFLMCIKDFSARKN